MTSCNDINDQIKRFEAELQALDEIDARLKAEEAILRPKRKRKPVVLRTLNGEVIEADPGDFVNRVEADAMEMGSEVVRQMVRAGIDGSKGPRGRTGQMINYRQLDPTEDNFNALLEVMQLRRKEGGGGFELMTPFTEQLAGRELMAMAQQTGGDPRVAGEILSKRSKGLRNLPSTVYMIAKARWDSASQYADVLEELADAVDGGYDTPEIRTAAGNVAKWAYFYEQLDAEARRKVGQALRSLQFNKDVDVSLIDLKRDIKELSAGDSTMDSLVGDMLKLTAESNSTEMRRMARAKRMSGMLEGGVNESKFMADLRILNNFRKANLLSSIASWAVRNPVSGALVQGVYMGEDALSGTIRLVNQNGLKPGVADGLKAAGFAYRNFTSAWNLAWGNATEMLLSGKGTMTGDNPKFSQVRMLQDPQSFVEDTLRDSWERFTTPTGWLNPINTLNLMSSSVWKVFGDAVDKKFATDAGYGLPFRLLNAGDEVVRSMAYAWKSGHESFIRAAEEGRQAGKNIEWIERRADELTEETLFSGFFTDDQLADYRRQRNSEFGIPVSEELSNAELRQMLFDQYHAAPNLQTEIGRLAKARTDDVAFTGDLKGNIGSAAQLARQNPIVDWFVPFFKVPVNGIGWVLNREVLIALPRQVLMEGMQLKSGRTQFSPEQMADARARTMVAAGLAAATHGLWEAGIFTDGGSFDPRQRERERRNAPAYSFSLAGTMLGAAKFRLSGIDVVDLMGLHADVLRALHEGLIGQRDAGEAIKKILIAHANLLKNKSGLLGIASMMNWAMDPDRYDAGKAFGDQMGGILPMSGVLGNLSRSFNDPEEGRVVRRTMTKEEMAALGKDPLYQTVAPVMDLLKSVLVNANANYPLVGLLQPRDKDWLGNTIERPLGLPLDQAIPFVPVVKPADPLYQWLAKHGFGDKPRPDGKITEDGVTIQMSNEEEGFYREEMRTLKGELPPEEMGLGEGRLMPIWQYVQGNDLQGALRKLMRDPEYNLLLNTPVGGVSPSLVAQPGVSLSKRKESGGKDLYFPIDDIIKYYDHLALTRLLGNPRFNVGERYQAVIKSKVDGVKAYAAEVSATGTLMP